MPKADAKTDGLAPEIAHKLALLPLDPGVYLMKDAKDRIIYIGKAVNLRNRVRGYFTGPGADNHLASRVLRAVACDMEWIVTRTEVEALILEANLIRKHTPRYNVDLKDDKHYPYIRVTVSEPFPRLLITRQAEKGTGANRDLYFGPYTNARAMRNTVQYLNRVFRIRDCDLKLPAAEPLRPCLSYHIKRCDAPCARFTGEAEYRKLVDEAVLLLKGRRHDLRARLEGEMRAAAAGQRFEDAGRIRDQIRDLETVQERQRVDLGSDQDPKDFVAVRRSGSVGAVVVLEAREGLLSDRKQFEVRIPLEQDEGSVLTEFLTTYYLDRTRGEIPREILLSHEPPGEDNMEALLREVRGGAVTIEVPQRGEKRRQMELALANADIQLAEYLARREKKERLNHRVAALREDLGLQAAPTRIEGFDISHLSGTDTVASNVVFVEGKPSKKDYRHYNVKTVEGIDDFASMREVLGRRFRRLRDEEAKGNSKDRPDLILIDGGKGQLHMAVQAQKEFGFEDIPIIGLAKRIEEIFFPHQSDPLLLPKTSAALQLLQQVRDEAHRFAITFQRGKRKAKISQSWLDEVPGVGHATKMKLIRAFRSPLKVREATGEELAAAAGKAAAKRILDWLHQAEAVMESAPPPSQGGNPVVSEAPSQA
ncbi:MAG TPA: excinuclease ABC subunit UvrC, partial [Fibrobacteria bacterium]|nr:excinuclease ABC subunit UvrC [Fibrobacteria bacterium]